MDSTLQLSESCTATRANAVHLVLQKKGGIGKTLVASWIAEHLRLSGNDALILDADPSQKTLAKIKALNVTPISILTKNEAGEIVLDTPRMDDVFSRMLETEDSVVLDCGGSGYERVTSYLLANEMIQTLTEVRRVVVHCIVVGSRDYADTAEAMMKIVKEFPENVEKVIWINPHFGPLEFNGQSFEESAFVRKHRESLAGIVYMPKVSHVYTEGYFNKMLSEHLTFGEVLDPDNKEWNAIAKMRMRNLWNPIQAQIAAIV